jgi:hypothetical protein
VYKALASRWRTQKHTPLVAQQTKPHITRMRGTTMKTAKKLKYYGELRFVQQQHVIFPKWIRLCVAV